jgi:hypothetical protein
VALRLRSPWFHGLSAINREAREGTHLEEGARMLRRCLSIFFFVATPVAAALSGIGTFGCGGCYDDGASSQVVVDPQSDCLTASPGKSFNGCGHANPSGVDIHNACSDPLILPNVTIAAGTSLTVQGDAPTSGTRRLLTGTIRNEQVTIGWLDAVEAE